MSIIKVNKIENTSTTDGGISIDNNGHVTVDGQQLPSAGALSHRNLVHNGAMVIAQRGTSESGLKDSPKFVVDRFAYRRTGSWGTNSFTMSQQSSGAPDGFTHFLRLAQSGTAAAPPTDTSCKLNTILEGFDIAQAGFGTSAAKDLTLSFYAKGSVAGTYCVFLMNQAADQSYIAEYSLTTSWTRFEITIPARTTGTWLTDNGKGFEIHWVVAADSDSTTYGGSAGWNTANARWTSNQTETFASTSGATFDLCGVQLEIGKKATPFEHRSVSDELARCQRYFQKSYNLSVAPGTATTVGMLRHRKSGITSGITDFVVRLNPSMRNNPTVVIYSTSDGASGKLRNETDSANVTSQGSDIGESGFHISSNSIAAYKELRLQYTAEAEL